MQWLHVRLGQSVRVQDCSFGIQHQQLSLLPSSCVLRIGQEPKVCLQNKLSVPSGIISLAIKRLRASTRSWSPSLMSFQRHEIGFRPVRDTNVMSRTSSLASNLLYQAISSALALITPSLGPRAPVISSVSSSPTVSLSYQLDMFASTSSSRTLGQHHVVNAACLRRTFGSTWSFASPHGSHRCCWNHHCCSRLHGVSRARRRFHRLFRPT